MGLSKQQQARLKAFGDGISYSEGTKGYNTYFGGGSFDNSKPHPGKPLRSSSGGQSSSAAGRYQFMDFTWKDIWKGQNPPMTEENQEKAFVILLKRRGAYDDVLKGNFEQAYKKVSNEWASVKGNSYTFNGATVGTNDYATSNSSTKAFIGGDGTTAYNSTSSNASASIVSVINIFKSLIYLFNRIFLFRL